MTNAMLRFRGSGGVSKPAADPLSSTLDPLAEKIGWEQPRNWVSEVQSGRWSFVQDREENFIDWVDYLYFLSTAIVFWMILYFAGKDDMFMSIVSIFYFLMLLLTSFMASFEEIKPSLLGFAFIYFGDKTKQLDYVKWGAIFGASFIALSIVMSDLGQQEVSTIVVESFLMMTLINIIVIPMAEELLFRGFVVPYLSESFGVVPSLLASSVITLLYHMAIYDLTPYMMVMTFIASFMFAFLASWKKALLPSMVAHAIINFGAMFIA